MRNKLIGLTLGLMVGVMSLMPAMTVSAADGFCNTCGEEGIAPVVLGYKNGAPIERNCVHGLVGTDFWYPRYELTQFYCGDCDQYWIDEIYVGTSVDCKGH